jgi:tetratricopeptide (TPR) repeat protein
MNRRRIIALGATGLLLVSVLCAAQAGPDKQRQIEEHSRKAQEFLRAGQRALAIPELQALVALDPENVDALGNLGVLLYFNGDCAGAVPHLRTAIKLQPDLWKIQVLLGICEKRQGDLAGARADLEASFPHLVEEKVRTQAGLELIELYSSTGDLAKAAAVVEVLRAYDPTNLSILYAAYRIYSDLAGDAMLSISMVDPNSAQMHQVMAHETQKQGDRLRAIAQYREALKIDPDLPGIHFELAEMLNSPSEGGNKEEAEAQYKAALVVNNQDEKAMCRLGEMAAQRGDFKESYARYERALQLQPLDSDAALGLAKALDSLGEPQKALPLLEQVVQRDPTNAMAHFRLGTLYRHDQRIDDAKRELALYLKYKQMKDRLSDIYKQMRLQPARDESTETDEQK